MDRSTSAPHEAPPLLAAAAPPVDFPPVLATPGGLRLGAMLARVPAFDWCHWGEALTRIKLAEVAAALRFSEAGCARVRIAASPEAEIVLVGWLPGQALSPDAHGGSEGLVQILSGRANAQRHELDQGTLRAGEERVLWAGDQIAIGPEAGVRLTNPGPGVLIAVCLHAPGVG
jgi:mannose-6-phosphate isomerase-like protein (cupin superfamily)